MKTVDQLERCMASAGVLDIIIGKFEHKQKPSLIVLFEINKDLEIGFYSTILPINLAICLRVEGGREPLYDFKEVAQ